MCKYFELFLRIHVKTGVRRLLYAQIVVLYSDICSQYKGVDGMKRSGAADRLLLWRQAMVAD